MLGLAIDSANREATAALWRADAGGQCDVLAEGALPPETGKADQLITVIERLLAEQGLGYADLELIAVNRGPGSFTGIRSAVALARGLALAAGLPVMGVTSHDALAAGIDRDADERPLVIALDARRGEVYAQTVAADGRALSAIEAMAPAELAARLGAGAWRLAGQGAGLVAQALDAGARVEMIETRPLDAALVARSASRRLAAGETPGTGFDLRPLYVRAPDAKPPAPLVAMTTVSEVPS